MAHKALEMECPHCDTRSNHKTHGTDPKYYHFDNEITEIFKIVLDKDISFRKRTKWCKKCEKHFDTAETALNNFTTLTAITKYYKHASEKAVEEKSEYSRMWRLSIARIKDLENRIKDLEKEKQDLTRKPTFGTQ